VSAANLDSLLEAMRADSPDLPAWDSLPTFGGEAPADTQEVWSWDAARLIVGSCSADVSIVTRDDWADDA
jgi:hypothetical protein